MTTFEPLYIGNLLSDLDSQLIAFLEKLSPEDWSKKTLAGYWTVKDVAAHLLDGNLRSLSMLRDRFFGEMPGEGQTLLQFLNGLNADWVKAMSRLSPTVLTDLLKSSGQAYCEYISGLKPHDEALFPVAWAGEEKSENWFHIAREYTEKWHHQQQIRQALGEEKELFQAVWYHPYLNTSVRALPYHYRQVQAAPGTSIKIEFVGSGPSFVCYLLYREGKWQLFQHLDTPIHCHIQIPETMAWQIFTKAVSAETAAAASEIRGDGNLARPVFDLRAVMV